MGIGEVMLKDMCKYSFDTIEGCQEIAEQVRAKMKEDIDPLTPYGTGEIRRVTGGHFDEYSDWVKEYTVKKVGHLKGNWRGYNITVGDHTTLQHYDESTIKLGRTIYGVRNIKKPQLVHLINFKHRIFSHGKDTGKMTKGNPFVDEITMQGTEELERRLDEYFRDR